MRRILMRSFSSSKEDFTPRQKENIQKYLKKQKELKELEKNKKNNPNIKPNTSKKDKEIKDKIINDNVNLAQKETELLRQSIFNKSSKDENEEINNEEMINNLKNTLKCPIAKELGIKEDTMKDPVILKEDLYLEVNEKMLE